MQYIGTVQYKLCIRIINKKKFYKYGKYVCECNLIAILQEVRANFTSGFFTFVRAAASMLGAAGVLAYA